VVVDFHGEPELLARHVELVEQQTGERVVFSVSGGVPAFLAEITASYQVRDLTVEQRPIEETVAELYRAEQS
jgi:ABC-type uncharacterized transport system ATPase subunit